MDSLHILTQRTVCLCFIKNLFVFCRELKSHDASWECHSVWFPFHFIIMCVSVKCMWHFLLDFFLFCKWFCSSCAMKILSLLIPKPQCETLPVQYTVFSYNSTQMYWSESFLLSNNSDKRIRLRAIRASLNRQTRLLFIGKTQRLQNTTSQIIKCL